MVDERMICPRCGGNLDLIDNRMLKCNYCDYEAIAPMELRVPEPPAPQVYNIDMSGMPGMPGGMPGWMGQLMMSGGGMVIPHGTVIAGGLAHELSPERRQAAIQQVRMYMGDEMADKMLEAFYKMDEMGITAMAQSTPVHASFGGGKASIQIGGQPAMPAVSTPPSYGKTRSSSGPNWGLIVGILAVAGVCLMVGGVGIVLMMMR